MTLGINNLEDLNAAGTELARLFERNKICVFYGEMGAGKTTLIKSLCHALGVTETVSSPTFSIVNEYVADGETIYHFDFYRIKTIQEAFDIGYEDYFYSGSICLIEWPEKIQELIPEKHIAVEIAVIEETKRQLTVKIYD